MIRDAVVEDPRGSTRRHTWDPAGQTWHEWRHPRARSPWPVNYGFLLGTRNLSDGEALDVMILSTTALGTGTRLPVRVIGLLPRPDGDHKVLAVAVADPEYGDLRRLAEVPADDLAAIERWFREWTTIGAWGEAQAAEAAVLAAVPVANR